MRDDEFRDSYSQVSVNVIALGRRLFWDRRGPLELYPHFPLKDQLLANKKPRTSFSGLAEDPDDPERLLIQLERSEAGCLWLRQQWAELRDILDQDLLWQSIDRFKAIRLLGRQPTDAADYSDVTTIYLACWIMHPQVKEIDPFLDVYNELLAGEAVQFRQRLADRVVEDFIPADKDEAKAKLLAIVTTAVDRLTILSKDHEAHAEAEAADRSARLAFDDSDEGERLRRYQIACGRSLNRSLDTLLKLRKAEEKRHPESIPTSPEIPAGVPADRRVSCPRRHRRIRAIVPVRSQPNGTDHEDDPGGSERSLQRGTVIDCRVGETHRSNGSRWWVSPTLQDRTRTFRDRLPVALRLKRYARLFPRPFDH